LTAFAFLIALGLLIDDSIVTIAAMTRYYRTGKFSASETGILVWRDFIVPLWSTTITTIWAFVPLLLATGIIGEFIKSIPIVVTAAMLSSTSIAVLITLPLMIVFLRPEIPPRVSILIKILVSVAVLGIIAAIIPKSVIYPFVLFVILFFIFVIFQIRNRLSEQLQPIIKNPHVTKFAGKFNNGFINIELLSNQYKNAIDRILLSRTARRSTLAAIIIFAVVGYSLVPLGFVKNEFFPKTDEDFLYIQVALPSGTNLQTTNTEMLQFVKKVNKTEEVSYFVADAGQNLGNNESRTNDSSSFLLTLHLTPHEKRNISSQVIAQRVRDKLKDYTKGTVNVVELSGGPPAGADIQITFLGDDLTLLNS